MAIQPLKAVGRAAILVVDDEELVRHFLRRMLDEAGYRVIEASNGDEALSILRTFSIDLVITDIRMPQMDGRELGRKIAELASPPPVVYASASDVPPEGVDQVHYLQKPFTPPALLGRVKTLLGEED